MRTFSILFSFLLVSSLATAQNGTYTAANEGWLVSLDEAYALSQKTGKPIMANFTGSDWCGWCKRLTASVFSKPEFKKWADKNVILLELDYPKRFKVPADIQQQNANMQQSFKVTGFPTVWVFNAKKDKTGNYSLQALGKTGYTSTVEEFTSTVDGFLKAAK